MFLTTRYYLSRGLLVGSALGLDLLQAREVAGLHSNVGAELLQLLRRQLQQILAARVALLSQLPVELLKLNILQEGEQLVLLLVSLGCCCCCCCCCWWWWW